MDVNAVNVRVEVVNVDDATLWDILEKSCGDGQVTFSGLAEGTYNVTVTPLGPDDEPLVRSPVSVTVAAALPGMRTEIAALVPYDSWTRSYLGQFLYRVSWGAPNTDCNAALVQTQNVKLIAGGTVVTATNDRGDLLDGSASADAPCWNVSEQFPQSVMGLPFGPAQITVLGKDVSNAVLFEQTIDTFIGAGTFNPTLTFVVAAKQ